jgi:outer membrane protein
MRDQKCFCARIGLTAATVAASMFVFGAEAVRAQTTPLAAAAATSTAGEQPQVPVRRLSIEEAVALALEQNVNLQVDRIDPQVSDVAVSVARSGWTPVFFSNVQTRSQTNPTTDIFGGAASITNDNLSSQAGVQQALPWGGANYTLFWNTGRLETDNIFSTFNPQLSSSIGFNYTQPLLRNFTIDATRQQVLVSRKNREISDVQLQQSITATVRNVKNAYWDLVYAISNLAVQQQSLQLAQQSYRDNRARVEIGTMAPLDIVQAEAEVAQREEAVILAEAAIRRQEDVLRALISNPVDQPEFWNMRLEPSEQPTFAPIQVNADEAVRNALSKRTDLSVARKQLENNDVAIRYFRNQSMPDVNALVNYSAFGLAGTRLELTPGLNPEVISRSPRSFGGALSDIFATNYPTWSLQLQVNYPIGGSTAEANLARARLQDSQARKQLQANELQVATQVRDLARNVTTNGQRVESTRAARALAEKRLEAEQKKFTAGMTSAFFVTQAQRDLADARNRELRAIIDYLKSVIDYQTAQEAPLGGGGGGLQQISTGGLQQQQPQQQQ